MSVSFVGNQKYSTLSILAKTTRMNALALCGNPGMVLLSVKDRQYIDPTIPGRYTAQAPYKTGAGHGNPEFTGAHNCALVVFLCHEQHYAQVMMGRAGPASVGPGSLVTGISTPVCPTTNRVMGSPGGELLKITREAAIMATILTPTQPEIVIADSQAVTSFLAAASFLSKRHDDVLKKIRTLECSASFAVRNSLANDHTDCVGRKLPHHQITYDGFAFFVMGLTGKRAVQFREAYTNAFNQTEKQLPNLSIPSDIVRNVSVLYSYISSIRRAWLQQFYPMLVKAESPLAISLYDCINDVSALACLINLSSNPSEVGGCKRSGISSNGLSIRLSVAPVRVSGTPHLQGMFYVLAWLTVNVRG